MSINHHSAPDSAYEVLENVLPTLLNSESVRVNLLEDKVSQLDYHRALPVFSIGGNTLADGRLLDDVVLISWRHLLFDGETPVAYIDLNPEATQVIKLTRGKFVELTFEGLQIAANLEETQGIDYHVNYIEIHSHYFAALWLQSDGETDLIIPLEDHQDGNISAMSVYYEPEILALLQQKSVFPALF